MSRLRRFWAELKMFMWYLFTEPFRQLWYAKKLFDKGAERYSSMAVWGKIFFGFFVLFAIADNPKPAVGSVVISLICFITYEWQNKKFIYKYRQRYKQEENENGK